MRFKTSRGFAAATGALIVGAVISMAAMAQTPPAGGAGMAAGAGPQESPADRAIEYRKAVYSVIGHQNGPIGGMVQGRVEYNGAEATKRAERLAQMAVMLDDAFPEISKTGDTKAKPEIWTDKAEFDKILKDFVDHTAALSAQLKKDNKSFDDFKKAATTVANDCKTCHDKFRAK